MQASQLTELINRVRYYSYMAGLLEGQERDPLCCICKAFSNTADRMKTEFHKLQSEHATEIGAFSEVPRQMISDTGSRLQNLTISQDTAGQKKSGNCFMPKGVCFIKSSKYVLDTISAPPHSSGDMQ